MFAPPGPRNGQADKSGIPLKTVMRLLICLASVSCAGYALQHTIQLTASKTSGRGGQAKKKLEKEIQSFCMLHLRLHCTS
jgi:hypothetical protein